MKEPVFMKKFIVCIVYILLGNILFAQQTNIYVKDNTQLLNNDLNKNLQLIKQEEGHLKFTIDTRDGKNEVMDIDFTEVIDIIVEFKDTPFFIQKKKYPNIAQNISYYENQLNTFSADVLKIQNEVADRFSIQLTQPRIKRQYYKAFFGASLEIWRGALSGIQNLPYVKKIHLNKSYESLLHESVSLIRADSVWSQYGTMGDSIEVGIIDSGIDYMHPSLGGGFGPGFKVFGGYDFVNNDEDPMDDAGHGTHVAGIVAANGDSIKGVAPNAKLMALKVLSQQGFGFEDWILAAIEKTVDPNGDGDFSDKLDVVNMSLGGPGDPDDALSTAVDNAVELGVVFCIAAGNAGILGFSTISSPGTSRLAITVGGSDKSDNIDPHGSKGPNTKIQSIKPEVVAPGVNIYSTLLNGEFGINSGTSMAAPHVAGVCALLKSIHPDWSPAQIKSALMTSAVDLGEEIMVQGSGRIDALNAAGTGVFAIPSHLSFGFDDLSQSIWEDIDTMLIVNQSGASKDYIVSWGFLPMGIQLEAAPNWFSIADGDTQIVVITLTVDNNVVASPPGGTSLAYSDYMQLLNTDEPLKIPWAFVKASKVTLTFDQPFPNFFFFNDKTLIQMWNTLMINPNTFEFVTASGVYELLTMFYDFMNNTLKFVVKEELGIDGFLNFTINSSEATHTFNYEGVNEQGNNLSSLPGNEYRKNLRIVNPEYSWFRSLHVDADMSGSFFVSDISNRYLILNGEFQSDIGGEEKIYVVNYPPISGIYGNVTVGPNSPEDYVMENLSIKFPSDVDYRAIVFGNSSIAAYEEGGSTSAGFADYITINSNEWNGVLYINPKLHKNYQFSTIPIARVTEEAFEPDWWLSGHPFTILNSDSIGCYYYLNPSPDLYITNNGGHFNFGDAPIYTKAFHQNNIFGESNIFFSPQFFGALNEERFYDVYNSNYSIYDEENNVIQMGPLSQMFPIDVSSGKYRFEILNNNYVVDGAIGTIYGSATLNTNFDLSKEDANPPQLTSLKLLNSDGIPSGRLETGEAGTFMFSAGDFYPVENLFGISWKYQSILGDSTLLYFKEYGTPDWQQISFTQILEDTISSGRWPIGRLYSADFSGITNYDSSAIDIKIIVKDQSGNSTEWTLEPAFSVGFGTTAVDQGDENVENLPTTYNLDQNYPNPFNPSTIINYTIPQTSDVIIKVFDIIGCEIETLVNEKKVPGNYKLTWNASNLASGIYFYRLQAGDYVKTKKMILIK